MLAYNTIEKTNNLELVNVRTSDKDNDMILMKDKVAIIPVMQQDSPNNNFVVIKEMRNALLDIPILSAHYKFKDKEDSYEVAEDLMKSINLNGDTELIGKLVVDSEFVPSVVHVFLVHLEGSDLSSVNSLGKSLSSLSTYCQNTSVLMDSPLSYAVKHMAKVLD